MAASDWDVVTRIDATDDEWSVDSISDGFVADGANSGISKEDVAQAIASDKADEAFFDPSSTPLKAAKNQSLKERASEFAATPEYSKFVAEGPESLNPVQTGFAGAASGTLGLAEAEFNTPEAVARWSRALSEGAEQSTGLPRALNPLRAIEYTADFIAKGKLPWKEKGTGGTSDIAKKISEAQEILSTNYDPFVYNAESAKRGDEAFQLAMQGDMSGLVDIATDPKAIAGFIGQSAPSLVTSYMSGGSMPFMAWMEAMQVSSDAREFEERTGQKISDRDFMQAQAQTGLVNGLLEKVVPDQLLKGEAGKTFISALGTGLKEFGTEIVQQGNQNLSEKITFDPEKRLSEGVVAAGIGGLGAGLGAGGAQYVAGREDSSATQPEAQLDPLTQAETFTENLERPTNTGDPITDGVNSLLNEADRPIMQGIQEDLAAIPQEQSILREQSTEIPTELTPFPITDRPNGTILVQGDRDTIRSQLASQGIEAKGINSQDGIVFGRNIAPDVRRALGGNIQVLQAQSEMVGDIGEAGVTGQETDNLKQALESDFGLLAPTQEGEVAGVQAATQGQETVAPDQAAAQADIPQHGAIVGFKEQTNIPNFEDAVKSPEYFEKNKNVVVTREKMSPDDYLEKVSKGFGKPTSEIIRTRDSALVSEYADAMRKGDIFPALTLSYADEFSDKFSQEGVHRALAAKQVGIKEIPVSVRNRPQATPETESTRLAVEPLNDKSIIIRGDKETIRARLENTDLPKGMWNAKQGGLVFNKKHSDKINQVLSERRAVEQPIAEDQRTGERRANVQAREYYSSLSKEQLLDQLLQHELTGIKGRRSFVIEHTDATDIISIDADSLKWINDNVSPNTGDKLLQAVADALVEEFGYDYSYHISGDEFYVVNDGSMTEKQLSESMNRVSDRLSGAILKETKEDGTTIIKKGLSVTHALDKTKESADAALKREKAAKEQRGERAARGEEPPGVQRVTEGVPATTGPVEQAGSDTAKPVDTEEVSAILDKAGITGKERLDVLRDYKDGKYDIEELRKAYPEKKQEVEVKPEKEKSNLPEIISTPKKTYLKSMEKKAGLSKESPGYQQALSKIEQDYEERLDRAYAELSFEEFNRLNPENSESVNKQAHDQLREEYGVGQPKVNFALAYHGTPHTFDEFSLDAIGTGEGVQAYGWGLYFAEKKSIADYYRRALSESAIIVYNDPTHDGKHTVMDGENVVSTHTSSEAARRALAKYQKQKGRGNVYQVNIPEDDELLDWDKPLKDQPSGVRENLEKAMLSDGWGNLLEAAKKYDDGDTNALKNAGYNIFAYPGAVGGLYQEIASELGERKTSLLLNKFGIKGLRYLDAMSRDEGNGSRNYVIWDADAVTIEAVNDELRQAKEQKANFSLSENEIYTGTGKGMPVEEVETIAAKMTLTWGGNARNIIVHKDISTLPKNIKSQIPDNATPQGIHNPVTGDVYLIAENLDSTKDVRRIVGHEMIGHTGMEEIVDSGNVIQGGWANVEKRMNSLVKSGNKQAKSLYDEVSSRGYDMKDQTTVTKEMLAIAAERHIQSGPIGRILAQIRAAIRNFLRAHGINGLFAGSDIDAMIVSSLRYLKRTDVPRETFSGALEHPQLGEIDIKVGKGRTGATKFSQTNPEATANLEDLIASAEVVQRDSDTATLKNGETTFNLIKENGKWALTDAVNFALRESDSATKDIEAIKPMSIKGLKKRANAAIDRIDTAVNGITGMKDASRYLTERALTQGQIGEANDISKRIYDAFKDIDEKSAEELLSFLTDKEASPSIIGDSKLRVSAVRTKALIQKVGKMLVERGVIPIDSYKNYEGRYLPRVYLAYLMGDKAIRAVGSGKKLSDQGYAKKRNEDLPQEYRDVVLGEIKDPAFLASRAIGIPLRDMALMEFFDKISQDQGWAIKEQFVNWKVPGFDKERKVTPYWMKNEASRLREQAQHVDPKRADEMTSLASEMEQKASEALGKLDYDKGQFRQVPDSPKYGTLRGMIVDKHIYDDIVGIAQLRPEDAGFAQRFFGFGGSGTKFTQAWKTSKVILNPPSQVRNVTTNFVLLNLSGVPMYKMPGLTIRVIKELKSKGKYYQIAKKYGLIDATFSAQEILKMEQELLDMRAKAKGTVSLANLARIASSIVKWAGDRYQDAEMLTKMSKVIYEMENGMEESAAVQEANKWLFDYSLVNQNIRYLRNAPVGAPFLTFYGKVLPRLLEVAVNKPWRYIPYIALMKGLPYVAMLGLGADDKDDIDRLEKALPQWLQDNEGGVILPMKDSKGRIQAMNIGYYLPWTAWTGLLGTVSDIATSTATGDMTDEMQGLMTETGLLGGPIPNLISASMTNIDPFTKREIVDERDPAITQWGQRLGYIYDLSVPSWLTDKGVAGHLYRAVTEHENRWGDPTATTGQALLRTLGMNIYPIEPEKSRDKNILFMSRDIQDVQKRLAQRLSDPNLSREQSKDIEKTYSDKIKRMTDRLKKYQEESRVSPSLR